MTGTPCDQREIITSSRRIAASRPSRVQAELRFLRAAAAETRLQRKFAFLSNRRTRHLGRLDLTPAFGTSNCQELLAS